MMFWDTMGYSLLHERIELLLNPVACSDVYHVFYSMILALTLVVSK